MNALRVVSEVDQEVCVDQSLLVGAVTKITHLEAHYCCVGGIFE